MIPASVTLSNREISDLATKLGDINAYLADAQAGYNVYEDIDRAYELSNELYEMFVHWDKKKEDRAV